MARQLNWTELQGASPLLAALPEPTRHATKLAQLAKSTTLFRRGDRPKAMYFVLTGEVHLMRRSLSGDAIIVQRGRSGFLAEASLDQNAYHCDALVVAPSRLLLVPRAAFLEALADESFRRGWMAHLARELRRVRAQAERMSLRTARDRIIHYIETEGEAGSIELRQSKKDWAAELGLTHEALYRTLARMTCDGQLRIDGGVVSIGS